MAGLRETDEIVYDANLVQNQTHIYIKRMRDARALSWDFPQDEIKETYWSKYQIKETDRRQKTATFSSPNYVDLTTGQYVVLITSPHHDDFGGIILKVEYNEDTGMYDYQCQDGTRNYLDKVTFTAGASTVYEVLRALMSKFWMGFHPDAKKLEEGKNLITGLLPQATYQQEHYGSIIKFNPMNDTKALWVKNKRIIDVIQNLVYGSGAYIDVYFNKYGRMQIEPYNGNEWGFTGLTLTNNELTKRKLTFDTTDIITEVQVNTDKLHGQFTYIYARDAITIDLAPFFGTVGGYVEQKEESTETKTGTSTTSTTSNSTVGNPFNNKAKKVWINSDNGSNDFKNSLITALRNKGWTVKDGGTCSNCHYEGYMNVTSDYSVYVTVYNGFCAGTIREAYSSKIQGILKNKGVELCVVWDTRTWTNPQGMAPYKYGDFTGYNAGRAWDDNFSSSDPSIKNVMDWLKKNNAKWCCSPTVDGVVEQFLAGGYLKYKGIK